jgi:hypothetical protein
MGYRSGNVSSQELCLFRQHLISIVTVDNAEFLAAGKVSDPEHDLDK